jgi:hypothetical protein
MGRDKFPPIAFRQSESHLTQINTIFAPNMKKALSKGFRRV